MRANELRIGNYHYYHIVDKMDERKEWYEVCQIDYDDLRILTIKDGIDEDYKPIPLTEEWLIKFGINRQISVFEVYGNNSRGFHIDLGGEWLFIKYVHTLQNLFFALTGEELKINH